MSESNNDSSDQTNVEARAKSNKLIKTKQKRGNRQQALISDVTSVARDGEADQLLQENNKLREQNLKLQKILASAGVKLDAENGLSDKGSGLEATSSQPTQASSTFLSDIQDIKVSGGFLQIGEDDYNTLNNNNRVECSSDVRSKQAAVTSRSTDDHFPASTTEVLCDTSTNVDSNEDDHQHHPVENDLFADLRVDTTVNIKSTTQKDLTLNLPQSKFETRSTSNKISSVYSNLQNIVDISPPLPSTSQLNFSHIFNHPPSFSNTSFIPNHFFGISLAGSTPMLNVPQMEACNPTHPFNNSFINNFITSSYSLSLPTPSLTTLSTTSITTSSNLNNNTNNNTTNNILNTHNNNFMFNTDPFNDPHLLHPSLHHNYPNNALFFNPDFMNDLSNPNNIYNNNNLNNINNNIINNNNNINNINNSISNSINNNNINNNNNNSSNNSNNNNNSSNNNNNTINIGNNINNNNNNNPNVSLSFANNMNNNINNNNNNNNKNNNKNTNNLNGNLNIGNSMNDSKLLANPTSHFSNPYIGTSFAIPNPNYTLPHINTTPSTAATTLPTTSSLKNFTQPNIPSSISKNLVNNNNNNNNNNNINNNLVNNLNSHLGNNNNSNNQNNNNILINHLGQPVSFVQPQPLFLNANGGVVTPQGKILSPQTPNFVTPQGNIFMHNHPNIQPANSAPLNFMPQATPLFNSNQLKTQMTLNIMGPPQNPSRDFLMLPNGKLVPISTQPSILPTNPTHPMQSIITGFPNQIRLQTPQYFNPRNPQQLNLLPGGMPFIQPANQLPTVNGMPLLAPAPLHLLNQLPQVSPQADLASNNTPLFQSPNLMMPSVQPCMTAYITPEGTIVLSLNQQVGKKLNEDVSKTTLNGPSNHEKKTQRRIMPKPPTSQDITANLNNIKNSNFNLNHIEIADLSDKNNFNGSFVNHTLHHTAFQDNKLLTDATPASMAAQHIDFTHLTDDLLRKKTMMKKKDVVEKKKRLKQVTKIDAPTTTTTTTSSPSSFTITPSLTSTITTTAALNTSSSDNFQSISCCLLPDSLNDSYTQHDDHQGDINQFSDLIVMDNDVTPQTSLYQPILSTNQPLLPLMEMKLEKAVVVSSDGVLTLPAEPIYTTEATINPLMNQTTLSTHARTFNFEKKPKKKRKKLNIPDLLSVSSVSMGTGLNEKVDGCAGDAAEKKEEDEQTDKHTEKPSDIQTDIQSDRHTDKQCPGKDDWQIKDNIEHENIANNSLNVLSNIKDQECSNLIQDSFETKNNSPFECKNSNKIITGLSINQVEVGELESVEYCPEKDGATEINNHECEQLSEKMRSTRVGERMVEQSVAPGRVEEGTQTIKFERRKKSKSCKKMRNQKHEETTHSHVSHTHSTNTNLTNTHTTNLTSTHSTTNLTNTHSTTNLTNTHSTTNLTHTTSIEKSEDGVEDGMPEYLHFTEDQIMEVVDQVETLVAQSAKRRNLSIDKNSLSLGQENNSFNSNQNKNCFNSGQDNNYPNTERDKTCFNSSQERSNPSNTCHEKSALNTISAGVSTSSEATESLTPNNLHPGKLYYGSLHKKDLAKNMYDSNGVIDFNLFDFNGSEYNSSPSKGSDVNDKFFSSSGYSSFIVDNNIVSPKSLLHCSPKKDGSSEKRKHKEADEDRNFKKAKTHTESDANINRDTRENTFKSLYGENEKTNCMAIITSNNIYKDNLLNDYYSKNSRSSLKHSSAFSTSHDKQNFEGFYNKEMNNNIITESINNKRSMKKSQKHLKENIFENIVKTSYFQNHCEEVDSIEEDSPKTRLPTPTTTTSPTTTIPPTSLHQPSKSARHVAIASLAWNNKNPFTKSPFYKKQLKFSKSSKMLSNTDIKSTDKSRNDKVSDAASTAHSSQDTPEEEVTFLDDSMPKLEMETCNVFDNGEDERDSSEEREKDKPPLIKMISYQDGVYNHLEDQASESNKRDNSRNHHSPLPSLTSSRTNSDARVFNDDKQTKSIHKSRHTNAAVKVTASSVVSSARQNMSPHTHEEISISTSTKTRTNDHKKKRSHDYRKNSNNNNSNNTNNKANSIEKSDFPIITSSYDLLDKSIFKEINEANGKNKCKGTNDISLTGIPRIILNQYPENNTKELAETEPLNSEKTCHNNKESLNCDKLSYSANNSPNYALISPSNNNDNHNNIDNNDDNSYINSIKSSVDTNKSIKDSTAYMHQSDLSNAENSDNTPHPDHSSTYQVDIRSKNINDKSKKSSKVKTAKSSAYESEKVMDSTLDNDETLKNKSQENCARFSEERSYNSLEVSEQQATSKHDDDYDGEEEDDDDKDDDDEVDDASSYSERNSHFNVNSQKESSDFNNNVYDKVNKEDTIENAKNANSQVYNNIMNSKHDINNNHFDESYNYKEKANHNNNNDNNNCMNNSNNNELMYDTQIEGSPNSDSKKIKLETQSNKHKYSESNKNESPSSNSGNHKNSNNSSNSYENSVSISSGSIHDVIVTKPATFNDVNYLDTCVSTNVVYSTSTTSSAARTSGSCGNNDTNNNRDNSSNGVNNSNSSNSNKYNNNNANANNFTISFNAFNPINNSNTFNNSNNNCSNPYFYSMDETNKKFGYPNIFAPPLFSDPYNSSCSQFSTFPINGSSTFEPGFMLPHCLSFDSPAASSGFNYYNDSPRYSHFGYPASSSNKSNSENNCNNNSNINNTNNNHNTNSNNNTNNTFFPTNSLLSDFPSCSLETKKMNSHNNGANNASSYHAGSSSRTPGQQHSKENSCGGKSSRGEFMRKEAFSDLQFDTPHQFMLVGNSSEKAMMHYFDGHNYDLASNFDPKNYNFAKSENNLKGQKNAHSFYRSGSNPLNSPPLHHHPLLFDQKNPNCFGAGFDLPFGPSNLNSFMENCAIMDQSFMQPNSFTQFYNKDYKDTSEEKKSSTNKSNNASNKMYSLNTASSLKQATSSHNSASSNSTSQSKSKSKSSKKSSSLKNDNACMFNHGSSSLKIDPDSASNAANYYPALSNKISPLSINGMNKFNPHYSSANHTTTSRGYKSSAAMNLGVEYVSTQLLGPSAPIHPAPPLGLNHFFSDMDLPNTYLKFGNSSELDSMPLHHSQHKGIHQSPGSNQSAMLAELNPFFHPPSQYSLEGPSTYFNQPTSTTGPFSTFNIRMPRMYNQNNSF